MSEQRRSVWRMLGWVGALGVGIAAGAVVAGSCTQSVTTPPPVIAPEAAVRPLPVAVMEPATAAPEPPPPLVWPSGMTPVEHPEALAPVLDKLAGLEAGTYEEKVRVIHYGDSHIAADVWTGTLRRNLQERFGDGGRGWVVPGKPWKSYRPMDAASGVDNLRHWNPERIKTRYTPDRLLLGLGGIAQWTSKKGALAWASVGEGTPATHVELYYLKHPEGGKLGVTLDGKGQGEVDTRGPQQAGGYAAWEVPGGVSRLEVSHVGTRGASWIYGAVLEAAGPGVVYDAVGINGARATMPLLWDKPLWSEQLKRRAPDLVVMTYGTNEVDDRLDHTSYAAGIREVLTTLKASRPDAACLVVGPPDRAWKVKGDALLGEETLEARQRAERSGDRTVWETPPPLLEIIATQRRVALEQGCAFWDTYAAMGGRGSIDAWARQQPPLAARDRVHLSWDGYVTVADRLTEALLHLYGHRQVVRGLEVPAEAKASLVEAQVTGEVRPAPIVPEE